MPTLDTSLPLVARWRKPWLAVVAGTALAILTAQLMSTALRMQLHFGSPLAAEVGRAGALAVGTLVSEDLTSVMAGELIRRSQLSPLAGVLGCFVGIYFGDLGLWLMGRMLGARVIRLPWLRRRLTEDRLAKLGDWFDRRSRAAVIGARFLPGTRLPLYVAAGALGRKGGRFALWTFLAAAVWTPLLVLSAAKLGRPLTEISGALGGFCGAVAVVLTGYALVRLLTLCSTSDGRQRLSVHIATIRQWEFWPAWLFYAPVAVWIACLSLRRGGLRGFASVTAANPGIPHGGFVGESKFEILAKLDPRFTLPTILLAPGEPRHRIAQLRSAIGHFGWELPIVLKPDVGQRGTGVRLVRTLDEATAYFTEHPSATIAQAYHSGPFEAGVFYYRLPNEPRGRIFSITDKHFPELVGDGHSTVAELILAHPRFRMQASTFLARHAARREDVLRPAERFRLAVAGNHCQGTLFRDGSHLRSEQLERRIDEIARKFDGFFFGRFDIRYADVAALLAGESFAIVELNGATAESTNIYDPSWSILQAYGTLCNQWSILFRIADINRKRGIASTSPIVLWRLVLDDVSQRAESGGSD